MGGGAYWKLSPRAKETALAYWQDRVKPNFRGSYDDDFADVEYFIHLAGATDDPEVPIKDGFFLMSSKDMNDIFNPVVCKIVNLVGDQTKAITKQGLSIKAIMLAGGFGASPYVFHRLQRQYPGSTIIQPPDGWSAVVKSAVHYGLEGNTIECRIARRHYGVLHNVLFDPKVHSDDDPCKFWDDLEETYRTSSVRENEPIRVGYWRGVRADKAASFVFHDTMYFCVDEDAPAIRNKGNVFKLCELESDLSQIPK
ncbi:hypothetical protein BDW69DRAFT_186084 [Aspergillus filifer]